MADHYMKAGAGQAGDYTAAATGFGLSGTSGVWSSREGGGVDVDGRAAANSALKVCSAAASGMSAFAATGSAAGPAGMIAGTALGLVAEGMQGGFEAYDAQKTRASLQGCLERANAQRLTDLADVLEHCIAKSNIKFRAGVGKATLVGQPAAMIYRTGKAIYKTAKGTKGKGRKARAEQLIAWAKGPVDPRKRIAADAIQAICQANFDKMIQDTVENAMKSS